MLISVSNIMIIDHPHQDQTDKDEKRLAIPPPRYRKIAQQLCLRIWLFILAVK